MRKNILLITTDQQHYSTIGAFNNKIKTPNLDRLVREGTYFNRAYCPNPTCTPTRASIITGLYPSQHGAYALGTKLNENVRTVGDILLENGYRTALIGKAHFQQIKSTKEYPSLESYPILQDLDFWEHFKDKFYGFEHVRLCRNHTCESHVGQHYAIWMKKNGLSNYKDYFNYPTGNLKTQPKYHWDLPEKYHYNNFIASESIEMLEKYSAKGDNFFLWSSFLDPHPPYLVPAPYSTMYDNVKLDIPCKATDEDYPTPMHKHFAEGDDLFKSMYTESGNNIHGFGGHNVSPKDAEKNMKTYYSMISMTDTYIGKILDKLDELGLSKNTLIIFTTDHGNLFGQHGFHAKGPFLYEDLIKIPLICKLDGEIPAGKVSNSLINIVDIAPTILGFAGIENEKEKMTGIDESAVLLGQKNTLRDCIICEDRYEKNALNIKAYVNERYKLIIHFGKSYGEMYDLKSDPNEHVNLFNNPKYQSLKSELLIKFINAELAKEYAPMTRVCMS